jgi:hypothetical protein
VYNKIPHHGGALSPKELFCGFRNPQSSLRRCHVFGCPVYVLEPALQDGKKIPKWDSKARQGIFVGFSKEHSTSVPLILNPRTSHVSPQFHVIFDDAFTTVPSLYTVEQRDQRFAELFSLSRECFVDPSDVEAGTELLDDHWLSPDDLASWVQQRHYDRKTSEFAWNFLTPSRFPGQSSAVIGTFWLGVVWESENFRRIPGIVPIAINPYLHVARFVRLDLFQWNSSDGG